MFCSVAYKIRGETHLTQFDVPEGISHRTHEDRLQSVLGNRFLAVSYNECPIAARNNTYRQLAERSGYVRQHGEPPLSSERVAMRQFLDAAERAQSRRVDLSLYDGFVLTHEIVALRQLAEAHEGRY